MHLHEGNWKTSILLISDHHLLVADSKEKLRDLVFEFERVAKVLKMNPEELRKWPKISKVASVNQVLRVSLDF